VPRLIEEHSGARPSIPLAIGLDVLAYLWSGKTAESLRKLVDSKQTHWLFLSCDPSVLLRRYQETRRPHPIRKIAGIDDLKKAIASDSDLLSGLRELADSTIDSTSLSSRQLARLLEDKYASEDARRDLIVRIVSFGFKHGAPRPLDLLLDVRFLRNPYYVPELKPKTGQSIEIQEFVYGDPHYRHVDAFFTTIVDLVPLYRSEGKSYLNIGIGCTGGKHRSVASAENLHKMFQKTSGVQFILEHRDVDI